MKQANVKIASQTGVLHHVVPLAIIVVFGIAGIGLLVSSHAATPPSSSEPAEAANTTNGSIAFDARPDSTKGSVAYKNWSGYAATGKTFTKVYAAVVVPTITCPQASSGTLFWVGFDGFALTANQTVEQTGIGAQCDTQGGQPSYFGFWEMRVNRSSIKHVISSKAFSVAPGQKIDEMVTYNRKDKYVLSLKNLATDKSITITKSCPKGYSCKRQSAEWIGERPFGAGGYEPLAPWGTMQFTNTQAATNFSSSMKPANAYTNTLIDMFNEQTESPWAQVSSLQKGGKVFTDESI